MRIVSLLPSATEIVFALGLGDDLAGVTFECDFPPEARGKRIISSSGLEASADDPEAIDAAVRAATEGGVPLLTACSPGSSDTASDAPPW